MVAHTTFVGNPMSRLIYATRLEALVLSLALIYVQPLCVQAGSALGKLHRLAFAFAITFRICDKYQNHMIELLLDIIEKYLRNYAGGLMYSM